jgi:TIR domain
VIRHAAAMVSWKTFRPGGGRGGEAVYDYGSKQRRLLGRVADGGTLWLVTSTRRGRQPRHYHLAYKLVDCVKIYPHDSKFSGQYDYVVRAQDWRASRHFGVNDATSTLQRLQFTSGKPMAEVTNPGLRLLSIPALSTEDVELLERLQHKIEHGRNVFISYAHEDAAIASLIERELANRDVSVSRDVSILHPGQRWEDALRQEVAGTDCFVVLVSPNSAAARSFVRREVAWALAEYAAGGLVTTILPVLLAGGDWEALPELHRFHAWNYPARTTRTAAFDRLAEGIAATTQRSKRQQAPNA